MKISMLKKKIEEFEEAKWDLENEASRLGWEIKEMKKELEELKGESETKS